MRFFAGQMEYEEIYYDQRTRLESIIRDGNDLNWGKKKKDFYFAVTKVTMTAMDIVCAIRSYNIDESEAANKVKVLLKETVQSAKVQEVLNGNIKIKEVTLNAFMTNIDDNALGKLFHDKKQLMEEIRIDITQKCFKEYLLSTEYWNKEAVGYDFGFVRKEEILRINKGRRITEPVVQPIHYVISEEDDETVKDMIREIMHYLCSKGRICCRRVVKIDNEDYLDLLLSGKIQNLNTLDGGTVVLDLRHETDNQKRTELLRAVYQADSTFCETYTAIVVTNTEDARIFNELKKYCSQWAFVEIRNPELKTKEAEYRFRMLMERDNISEYKVNLNDLIDANKTYTNNQIMQIYKKWYRNTFILEEFFPQYKEIVNKYFGKEENSISARKELEQLIGLKEVKNVIEEIIDFFKVQKIRGEITKTVQKPTMHMAFYGNPGTAKTTVARLVGKILKEENILDTGDMIEVGRSDLVGKYVGWTAKTVKEYFEKAKGSVLFIDEAYSLVDEQKSFGDEAINTIVQEMENHREDVVVIFAGYRQEIEKLLNKNRGLKSRIAIYINFPDYSTEELFQILQAMVKVEGMLMEKGVKERFINKIMQMDTGSGNGRIVRNLLDAAKLKQASRIMKLSAREQMKELMILKEEDFV